MREGAAAAGLLDAIFRVSRILLDWIHGLLMAAAGNVIVLSSIKISAPARKSLIR
jgi:hypothetical protein